MIKKKLVCSGFYLPEFLLIDTDYGHYSKDIVSVLESLEMLRTKLDVQ
jgi:hypothetical protein